MKVLPHMMQGGLKDFKESRDPLGNEQSKTLSPITTIHVFIFPYLNSNWINLTIDNIKFEESSHVFRIATERFRIFRWMVVDGWNPFVG